MSAYRQRKLQKLVVLSETVRALVQNGTDPSKILPMVEECIALGRSAAVDSDVLDAMYKTRAELLAQVARDKKLKSVQQHDLRILREAMYEYMFEKEPTA